MTDRNTMARYLLTCIWIACLAFCIFYLAFDISKPNIFALAVCAFLGMLGARMFSGDHHNLPAVIIQCLLMLIGVTLTTSFATTTKNANITLTVVALVPLVFSVRLISWIVIGNFLLCITVLIASEMYWMNLPLFQQFFEIFIKLVTITTSFFLTYALRSLAEKQIASNSEQ
ncbi:hypothetical protein [Bdellovibrio sp. HCB288]|uniref:hypothetical protein n=1 Tax=Bdellovibrio sp. HCB288 TaxID=3394355 RepID=UPI0039B623EC